MRSYRCFSHAGRRAQTIALASICLWSFNAPSVLASSETAWQPQLSEKIVMFPPQQIERAVEADYKTSVLASELNDLDGQISKTVGTIKTLTQMSAPVGSEEEIELRHQTISTKRDYIKLMGNKLNKNRERLQSKLAVYDKLRKQAKRQAAHQSQKQSVANLQLDARNRALNVQARVDESLSLLNYEPASEMNQSYTDNVKAISVIRDAISRHAMQSRMPLADLSDQPQAIQDMISQVEAELSLLFLEEELLGHMAQLLALDAMELADDVASKASFAQSLETPQALSLSAQAIDLFAN